MFFDTLSEIPDLAIKAGFSIFVLPDLKNFETSISSIFETISTYKIEPTNGKIRIDQIRELTDYAKIKQNQDQLIIVKHAETMTEDAENAFLKLLEEPNEHYHFIFLADKNLGKLLPTVLSRAKIYSLREPSPLDDPVKSDEKTKALAKRLISATPAQLVSLATELSDKKRHKSPRDDALKITETAIEILYKSYFATKNPNLLLRLAKFLNLYQNLRGNGHVKLHLVADLC